LMPGSGDADEAQTTTTVWSRGDRTESDVDTSGYNQGSAKNLEAPEEQKTPMRKVTFGATNSEGGTSPLAVNTNISGISHLTVGDANMTPGDQRRNNKLKSFQVSKTFQEMDPQVRSRMNKRSLEAKGELMRVAQSLIEAYGLNTVEVLNICELDEGDLKQINRKIVKDDVRFERQGSQKSLRLSMHGSEGTRKDSYWGGDDEHPELYEYAMIFQVGDEEEEVEYEENGETKTTTQFRDFAGKTFDTIRKIGPREQHEYTVPVDPEDPEKGEMTKSVWVGADMCVQTYKSRPKLNEDYEGDDPMKKYKHEYIIALVGMTNDKLKGWADLQQADLLLNPDKAIEIGRENNFPLAHKTCAKGEKPGDDHKNIEYHKWNHCYAKYSEHANQDIYEKFRINPDLIGPELEAEENETVFAKKIRLRLIYEKLVEEETLGGAEIPIDRLMHDSNHPLIAVFPLHNETNRQWLDDRWLRKWNWDILLHPPLKDIRDYFNEPIGFYFGFMEHYIAWLFPLCLVGLVWQIFLFVTNDTEFKGMEAFMIFVIIWSVCFVDFWKRRENYLAAQWGMHNFERKAVSRPTFEGQWIVDEVTGEPIEEYPTEWARMKLCGGCSGLWFMILSVLAVTSTIIILRNFFTREGSQVCFEPDATATGADCLKWECIDGQNLLDCENAGGFTRKLELQWAIVLGVVNAIQIFIFNMIFGMVSTTLNEWENHKTQQAFDDSLVLKSFIFKFVNAFISLYYIAFVQEEMFPNGNTNEEIISLLRTQLASLFVTALVIQNFTEVMLPPLMKKAFKRMAYNEDEENDEYIQSVKLSGAEQQFEKDDYPNTLEDMAEIIIQYGYVTLFVMCLPLIPMLALINNILEIKVDGVKLVRNSRRPLPFGSDGLGSWVLVLEFFSVISVLTNAAVYTFRTDLVKELPGIGDHDLANKKNIVFFSVCTVLFIFMGVFKWLIRDVPLAVTKHLQRQEFIEDVLVKGQKYDPDRLKKLADMDAEIDSIQDMTEACCFGKFTATKNEKCCRCIPVLKITGDKTAEWTNPLDESGHLPVDELVPDNAVDYKEVTENLGHQNMVKALPVSMKTRAEFKADGIAYRPHRPTRVYDDRIDVGTHLSDGNAFRKKTGDMLGFGKGKKAKSTPIELEVTASKKGRKGTEYQRSLRDTSPVSAQNWVRD